MVNPGYAYSQVLHHGLVLTVTLLLAEYLGSPKDIPIEWMALIAGAYAIHVAGSILTTQFPLRDRQQYG